MQEYITIEGVTEEPFEKRADQNWEELSKLYNILEAMAVKLPSAYENPDDIQNLITKAKIEASQSIEARNLVKYYRVRKEDGFWRMREGRQTGFFYSSS